MMARIRPSTCPTIPPHPQQCHPHPHPFHAIHANRIHTSCPMCLVCFSMPSPNLHMGGDDLPPVVPGPPVLPRRDPISPSLGWGSEPPSWPGRGVGVRMAQHVVLRTCWREKRWTNSEERKAIVSRTASNTTIEHDQKTRDRSDRGSDPVKDRPKQKQKKQPRNVDTTMEANRPNGALILAKSRGGESKIDTIAETMSKTFENRGFRISHSDRMLPDAILNYAGNQGKPRSLAVKFVWKRNNGNETSPEEIQTLQKLGSTFRAAHVIVLNEEQDDDELFYRLVETTNGKPSVTKVANIEEACQFLDTMVQMARKMPDVQPEGERNAIAGSEDTILETVQNLPLVSSVEDARLLLRAFGSIANLIQQCGKTRPSLQTGCNITAKEDLKALSNLCRGCAAAVWNHHHAE